MVNSKGERMTEEPDRHSRRMRFRLRRNAALPPLGGAEDFERVERIIEDATLVRGDPFLAFSGDKRFIWSKSGATFLMFAPAGRAWVAMGEPVGFADEGVRLALNFAAAARAARAWPAFFDVSQPFADLLAAHRFHAEKTGERAIVDLAAFTISGKGKKDLRFARNLAQKNDCRFEVRPPGAIGSLEPALRRVSDAWLVRRGGVEKSFSLGRYDPDYIARFSLALSFRGDELVAFSNIWMHGGRATMDLMRFADNGPGGGMDYLFTELCLWTKAQGLQTLDLGLAPLAGLAEQERPSTVARLGGLVYARGERFYGFEGLRAYKDKFDPHWEPAYIVAGNAWRAAAAAVAVASLTGGGVRKLLSVTRPPRLAN
jgi:lysylphosphatidylglycerol synthetase-like protein (DUF2156 family)